MWDRVASGSAPCSEEPAATPTMGDGAMDWAALVTELRRRNARQEENAALRQEVLELRATVRNSRSASGSWRRAPTRTRAIPPDHRPPICLRHPHLPAAAGAGGDPAASPAIRDTAVRRYPASRWTEAQGPVGDEELGRRQRADGAAKVGFGRTAPRAATPGAPPRTRPRRRPAPATPGRRRAPLPRHPPRLGPRT